MYIDWHTKKDFCTPFLPSYFKNEGTESYVIYVTFTSSQSNVEKIALGLKKNAASFIM